jgi:predicted cobalt transporter CbtA
MSSETGHERVTERNNIAHDHAHNQSRGVAAKKSDDFVPAAKGLKRAGMAVASLLVAALAVLLILSLVIPADTVRDAVKAQIRAVTGLDPVLRGDVSVSLFPTGQEPR